MGKESRIHKEGEEKNRELDAPKKARGVIWRLQAQEGAIALFNMLEQRSGMGHALILICIQGTSALVPPQAILGGETARIRMLQEAAAPSREHGLCSSKLLRGFLGSELPSPVGRAGSSSYWCAAELAAPSSKLGVCWDSSDSSPTSHGNGIQRAQSSMLQNGWKTYSYQARKYLKD